MKCPDCQKEIVAEPIDPAKWLIGTVPAKESIFCTDCKERYVIFELAGKAPLVLNLLECPPEIPTEEWIIEQMANHK